MTHQIGGGLGNPNICEPWGCVCATTSPKCYTCTQGQDWLGVGRHEMLLGVCIVISSSEIIR